MSAPPLRLTIGNVPERFAYVSGEINALYAGCVFKGDDGGTQPDQRITAKKSFGDALGTTGKLEIDPTLATPTMTFYNTALNTTNQLTNSGITMIDTPSGNITTLSGGNIALSQTTGGVSITNIDTFTTPSFGNINVSFSDLSSGADSQTFIKSQFNQTETSVNVDDGAGNSASRTDITIGGACLDTHTATNGVATATSISNVGYGLGSINNHTFSNGGTQQNMRVEAQLSQTYLLGQTVNSSIDNGFSGFSNTTDAGLSSTYQTVSGSIVINQGAFNQNAGGSECLVSSAGITAGSSQLLRLQTPLTGDAILEHSVVGATNRNLGISSTGNILMTADNIDMSPTILTFPTLASPNFCRLGLGSGKFYSQSDTVGGLNIPQIELLNTNTSATISTGIPSIQTYKSGRNAQAGGDIISQQSYFAKDATGTKTEFGRIQVKTENVNAGNQDATMSFFMAVNGTNNEVFNLNGGQNEINCFRPLDLNGNALNTTSGNLLINASASTGVGRTTITSKEKLILNAEPTHEMELNANSFSITTLSALSPSAGGSSGNHLAITINGTPYKIALLNA